LQTEISTALQTQSFYHLIVTERYLPYRTIVLTVIRYRWTYFALTLAR